MTAITIQLQDELAEQLEAEAQRRNMSKEELAAKGVEKILTEPDESVKKIISEIIQDNAELYRRLA